MRRESGCVLFTTTQTSSGIYWPPCYVWHNLASIYFHYTSSTYPYHNQMVTGGVGKPTVSKAPVNHNWLYTEMFSRGGEGSPNNLEAFSCSVDSSAGVTTVHKVGKSTKFILLIGDPSPPLSTSTFSLFQLSNRDSLRAWE